MIGSLRGVIAEVHGACALVEIQGVGYDVRVPISVLSELKVGETCFFYIHDHIREDSRDLFGFLLRGELELFERLLSISGVGPKVALTILSAGSLATVHRAILQGDLGLLTSVPGVGKKTAQKIILELKGQLVDAQEIGTEDMEVIEALIGLGYPSSHAREALKSVSADIKDVSARVREALRYLAK